jgi:uncharacterized protein (TIGR03083 family)
MAHGDLTEDDRPSEARVADPLEALRHECEEVSNIVLALTEEEFAMSTRLPAWNVKELLGHMYRDINRTNTALSTPPPAEITADSVSYWRSYDPVHDAPAIADRAKELASGFATGGELAAAWDEMWRGALDGAEATDRSRIVITWGPALTLEEFLKTRVLEITVHRMDMEHALGRKGWGTDLAVSIVDDILEGLLGEQPPSDLEWDVLDFIETGTGRRQLTDGEREVLGPLADGFPLLG